MTAMIAFLRQLWGLVRPYRARLFLGVFMGFLAGLMSPLMIIVISLVASVIFPTANQKPIEEKLSSLPPFVVQWLHDARIGLESGLHQHRGALILFVALIPLVMLFGKLEPNTLALAMGGAWVLNLAVAEWLIRRKRPARPRPALA